MKPHDLPTSPERRELWLLLIIHRANSYSRRQSLSQPHKTEQE
jgi:hypothetical protein